jgi:hypothetical protein
MEDRRVLLFTLQEKQGTLHKQAAWTGWQI